MTAKKKVAQGTVCKHCREPIKRRPTPFGVFWAHVVNGNIYCADNLTGLTARFAEPS